MNKKEFNDAVAEELEITKKEAGRVIEGVFSVVEQGLLDEGSSPIGALGKLEIRERAERTGVNPQTKEKMTIPSRNAIAYKMNKYSKELVN